MLTHKTCISGKLITTCKLIDVLDLHVTIVDDLHTFRDQLVDVECHSCALEYTYIYIHRHHHVTCKRCLQNLVHNKTVLN